MKFQDLSKMGSALVSLEEYEGVQYIKKQNVSPVEIGFYQFAAKQLVGVNTPKLLKIDGNNLFIEYIPNKITLDELNNNIGTLEQLAHIHQSHYRPSFKVKGHSWSLDATELALETLKFPKVIQDSILSIQSRSEELFEHSGLISGDSNHGNWGTRNNGELVLFDWERFGFGSPAIDLAPLVRGLGDSHDYQSIAEKYASFNSKFSSKLLEKQLLIAKTWILIEVTNILTSRNKPDASIYINWYRANVPTWIESVGKTL